MSTVAALPHAFRDAVTREFQGEPVLWVGQPSARQSFFISTLIWLFAVPWTAFSLGWEVLALQGWLSGKPSPSTTHSIMGLVFPLFGVPFVLFGLGMMLAPFWAWARARRTVYVISGRRLACLTIGRSFGVKSYDRASIVRTERSERPDGSGSLKIVTGVSIDNDGDRKEQIEHLYGIADVRKVERLIAPYANKGSAS